MKTIEIFNQLNVFNEPDTQSELLGKLGKGFYELAEIKKNHPDNETDFAKVYDAEQQRNVWICSRYKDLYYAREERLIRSAYDFSGDEMAIDEKDLIALLEQFVDFSYDLHQPAYPFNLTGIKVPLAPPTQNNCCTFVEGLLVRAWQNATGGVSWDNRLHGQMMIYSSEDYFSPITCLADQKMAVGIRDADKAPEHWTVVQGWRAQWRGGHTFIILDYDEETDRVLTLESNSGYELDGVGYRSLGNIKNHPHPGAGWWQNDALWTWKRFKETYPYRKMAKLKVNNVQWVAGKND